MNIAPKHRVLANQCLCEGRGSANVGLLRVARDPPAIPRARLQYHTTNGLGVGTVVLGRPGPVLSRSRPKRKLGRKHERVWDEGSLPSDCRFGCRCCVCRLRGCTRHQAVRLRRRLSPTTTLGRKSVRNAVNVQVARQALTGKSARLQSSHCVI